MQERPQAVTFAGNPLTLLGAQLEIGKNAPNFQLIDNDLRSVSLYDFYGKTIVLLTVPSLDTPVCEAQTRRFNQEAANLDDDIQILCVSMDLPFAQKRWCTAAGIEQVSTLSAHRSDDFGIEYGVLIKELRLLSRSIFIIDQNKKITYVQNVGEITEEPDYQSVLDALSGAIRTSQVPGDGFCGAY